MKRENINDLHGRRNFIKMTGLGIGAGLLGFQQVSCRGGKKESEKVIQGFEDTGTNKASSKIWTPISERKVRVGLVGYGVSKFAAAFGFQNHPNVEVVAVSDLFPDRCAELAKVTKCNKTYPSLEELVKDDSIEAVFVATDAPSHARHCIEVLKHGKHVATAVPAVFGSLEEAEEVIAVVKSSGLKYMMFETSIFRENLYAMRKLYQSGSLGNFVYAEGEYWHYFGEPIDSFNGWRIGLPPQYYPTHSNAYYVGVTEGSFTEVSCMGVPSIIDHLKPENNIYKNPFGAETALLRTSEGGNARMAVCWESRGHGYGSETGRVRGTKGSYYDKYDGIEKNLPDIERPPLPPDVQGGGHGGSHGRLMDEFVTAILEDRKPLVDIAMALNMTVPGIVAHQSALKNGELMKIPQYKL